MDLKDPANSFATKVRLGGVLCAKVRLGEVGIQGGRSRLMPSMLQKWCAGFFFYNILATCAALGLNYMLSVCAEVGGQGVSTLRLSACVDW